jgi:flagellar hook-length control protein FliK
LEGLAPGVNNKISLYSAQYASRLGMLVVDKVLKGQQNFEIHLEPESFGKIKVNVFLDKQAIDIRMVAETQAAASLLRANEDSLLQITAQNGMKLANFAVGMQSGSEQQRQNSNQNRNRVTDKANNVLKHDAARNSQSQTSYRTSTSLNLIA